MLEQTAHKTVVTFLLDRTGSMDAIKTETVVGFNAYLDTLEREAGDCIELTLLQFDSASVDVLCRAARLSGVPRLTAETYQPRAYTPLIDACVRTIRETEEIVARRRDRPKVIVIFQTDGEENASRQHSLDELRNLIERRRAEDWQFVFLGADIDAYGVARRIGILEESTFAYRGRDSICPMVTLAEESARFSRGAAKRVRFSKQQKRTASDPCPSENEAGASR